MNTNTDKDRLDWLQEGHALVALVNVIDKDKPLFTANFHEEDWNGNTDVRIAIDIAMDREKNPETYSERWYKENKNES